MQNEKDCLNRGFLCIIILICRADVIIRPFFLLMQKELLFNKLNYSYFRFYIFPPDFIISDAGQ